MRRVLLCFAALLWLPAVVLAAEPRAVSAQVADTIEREYFDPARAASIAAGLRSAAARGEFDAITHPQELASALTSAVG